MLAVLWLITTGATIQRESVVKSSQLSVFCSFDEELLN